MTYDVMSNPIAIALVALFAAIMVTTSIVIVVQDTKKMSLKVWMVFAFTVPPILGVLITRGALGIFQPMYLLALLIYPVLTFINEKVNLSNYIGPADIDIINAILALGIPTAILMFTQNFEINVGDSGASEALAKMSGLEFLANCANWLLVGVILGLAIYLIKLAVLDKGWRILALSIFAANGIGLALSFTFSNSLIETIVLALSMFAILIFNKKSAAHMIAANSPALTYMKVKVLNGIDIKGDGVKKTVDAKMPLCIAFMPCYFYVVFTSMLTIYSF